MAMKINFHAIRMASREWVLTLLIILLKGIVSNRARAVEVIVSGSISYNSSDPNTSQISDWYTGWGTSGISGRNYVGTAGGGSGVYLGNNYHRCKPTHVNWR